MALEARKARQINCLLGSYLAPENPIEPPSCRFATGGEGVEEAGGLSPRGAEQPYSCSVNRPLTSAASASTTSAACGPLASTVIVVPGPAASIIRPMIEVPPTTSWPRLTFTSQSNLSTVCTNFAEARACNPFLLQISSTRMIGAGFGG